MERGLEHENQKTDKLGIEVILIEHNSIRIVSETFLFYFTLLLLMGLFNQ